MNSNLPTGVAPFDSDKLVEPGGYVARKFVMTNSLGAQYDIFKMVENFSIISDITSPILTLTVSIRDEINFFEDFKLRGQEKLSLHLVKHEGDKSGLNKELKLTFTVVEYPTYTRDEASFTSYTLRAIQTWAYIDGLKKISRSASGLTTDTISSIFKNDLNVNSVKVYGTPASRISSVIPIRTPLSACSWLLSKSYDSADSPYFMFPDLQGEISIVPLSVISKAKPYQTYEKLNTIGNSVDSDYSYAEKSLQILSINSNLRMNVLSSAKGGAFASSTRYFDIATKSFYTHEFRYDKTMIDSSMKGVAPADFNLEYQVNRSTEQGASLAEMSSSCITNVPVNSGAFDYDGENSSTSLARSLHRMKSFKASMFGSSHDILVYGDFALIPGIVVQIRVPKAISSDDYSTLNGASQDKYDQSISGRYVVALALHLFSGGVHTTQLKLIKDN